MSKSIFGLDENIAAALSYLFAPVTGFLVYVMEQDNKYVRFHALQATLLGLVFWVVKFLCKGVPVLRWFLSWSALPVLSLAYGILVLFLIYNAFTGGQFKVPFIGHAAYQQVNK